MALIISHRNAPNDMAVGLFENQRQKVSGEFQFPLANHVFRFCCDTPETLSLWFFELQPYHLYAFSSKMIIVTGYYTLSSKI